MKFAWLSGVAVGAALVGGVAAWNAGQAHAVREPAPSPNTVGIVDLETLMNGLQELKDRNAVLDRVKDEYREQLNKLNEEIKTIEAQLKDNIPKDDRRLRASKAAELVEKRNLFDFRKKSFETLVEMQAAEIIRELYAKVNVSIGELAQREGYDLILLDDRRLVLSENATLERLNNEILSKRVLFARPDMDLTQRLMTILNNDYAANGTKPQG
ncbi:MAG TPA: OmpH family outer membrane protein [Phycisphaerales bacterium]|nr:OmpH family outer membrane protein [Phycisphaerales bacterium]